MTSVRLALALSLAQSYASIAIALAGNMAVARILTPGEIGIFSVSFAVISIAQVLRDFGVGNFLVQQREISDAHIRTAFGIALILGVVLFVAVFAVAPVAAAFYGESQMADRIRISSLNFLIVPFSVVPIALLQRDIRFKRIVPITLSGLVAATLTTIGCALAGLGANSMAVGSVAGNIVTTIGAAATRDTRFLILPALSEWRSLLGFGSRSSVMAIVTTISMSANDLVVGRVLGFYSVAMLSRAQGIMSLVSRDLMAAVRSVALPGFAAARRQDEDLDAIYLRSMSLVTVIAWPLFGLLAIFPLEVLRLLFGPQWDDAVALVAIFCLSGALLAVNGLYNSFLIGLGRIDLAMSSELIVQPLRFALIVGAALVFRTAEACALAHLVASASTLFVFYIYRARAIRTELRPFLCKLYRSFLVSAAALLPALGLAAIYGFGRSEPIAIYWVVSAGLITLATAVLAAQLARHPIADEPILLRFVGPAAPLGRLLRGRGGPR